MRCAARIASALGNFWEWPIISRSRLSPQRNDSICQRAQKTPGASLHTAAEAGALWLQVAWHACCPLALTRVQLVCASPMCLGQRRAYKYVPYGPVDEVVPYLIRRTQDCRHGTTQHLRTQARAHTITPWHPWVPGSGYVYVWFSGEFRNSGIPQRSRGKAPWPPRLRLLLVGVSL